MRWIHDRAGRVEYAWGAVNGHNEFLAMSDGCNFHRYAHFGSEAEALRDSLDSVRRSVAHCRWLLEEEADRLESAEARLAFLEGRAPLSRWEDPIV